MKHIAYILLLLTVAAVFSQTKYKKNEHVKHNTKTVGGKYIISYTFKDHHENICTFNMSITKEQVDEDINQFGLPQSMFDSFLVTPENIARREEIIKRGLFMEDGDKLVVDKSAMINRYSSYTEALAKMMIEHLRKNYTDTRLERIKLAMCFVQDIPYGIPVVDDPEWFEQGIIPAPAIFVRGYGDCDSKAILFAGILCNLIDYRDIRFAGATGHMYTAIKISDPNFFENNSYSSFELEDGTYVVAETAGPGRAPLGKKHNRVGNSATIEEINFHPY